MFLMIHSLSPFGKFCLWAFMTAINVSNAMCQLPIHQFASFGKILMEPNYTTVELCLQTVHRDTQSVSVKTKTGEGFLTHISKYS